MTTNGNHHIDRPPGRRAKRWRSIAVGAVAAMLAAAAPSAFAASTTASMGSLSPSMVEMLDEADTSAPITLPEVRKFVEAYLGSTAYDGTGVDVAVIDTGVAPVLGLDGSGKVLHGPDLSFEGESPAAAYLDTYGHGTHMAGIIAGNGPTTKASPPEPASSASRPPATTASPPSPRSSPPSTG